MARSASRGEAAGAALVGVLALCVALTGCEAGPAPRDLAELTVRDSLYLHPETMSPYSGPVFRAFPDDPRRRELEGALLDGTWHGELVVYHPSGRVRYMGAFHLGERCGPWTENAADSTSEGAYDRLLSEIESLGMYPPCP